jgi:hypothetical protein
VALTGAAWHVEMAPDAQLNVYDPNAALPTDRCFGHPYAEQYHYHGYSWKCMNQGTAGKQSPLLGYAMDGFGIYGPRGADGKPIDRRRRDHAQERAIEDRQDVSEDEGKENAHSVGSDHSRIERRHTCRLP